MNVSMADKLQSVIAPTVEGMGYEFWGLECLTNPTLIRIFIESSNGISVDDCAKVSRQLSVLLDVEDVVAGEYRLEISSPGMARPLFSLEQYQRFIGCRVKVKLRFAFEKRKQFKGSLSRVDIGASELVLVVDDEEITLPYEMIEKASLIPEFQ